MDEVKTKKVANYLNDAEELQLEAEDAIGREYLPRATKFVTVPLEVERMKRVGMLLCADSYLHAVSTLPLRAVKAVGHLLRKRSFSKMHHIQWADIIKVLLIFISFFVVKSFNVHSIAKFIESESLMKLRMTLSMMEILGGVCSSYGEVIFTGMFWALRRQEMKPIFKHLFFAIVYMIAHSGLLVVHLTVLHVAMNEDNLGFLSVITLIQFNELKSAVMKDISYKKLEAMCHDDIQEMFQVLFLCVMLFFFEFSWGVGRGVEFGYNLYKVLTSLGVIFFSEILVDITKHTTIVNFMRYHANLYNEITRRFCVKYTETPAKSWMTDRTQNIVNAWGQPSLPYFVMSLVVIDKALRTHLQQPIFVRILAVMGFIASCFVLRIVVLWLLEYFVHYYASLPEPEEQLLSDKNEKKQEKPEHETETSDKKQAKSDKKKQQ